MEKGTFLSSVSIYHAPTQQLSSNEVFHPFPALPTELRLEIWRMALETWSIMPLRLEDDNAIQPCLTSMKWDPSVVGISCREANLVMKKSLCEIRRYPGAHNAGPNQQYRWINFDTTVFDMGSASASVFLGAPLFHSLFLRRLQHVLITATWPVDIAILLERLCPSLRTIVLLAPPTYMEEPDPAKLSSGDATRALEFVRKPSSCPDLHGMLLKNLQFAPRQVVPPMRDLFSGRKELPHILVLPVVDGRLVTSRSGLNTQAESILVIRRDAPNVERYRQNTSLSYTS